jgi:hypothetical protein
MEREGDMTEAEWEGCTDPEKMANSLLPRVSNRRWRLFGVACVRRVAHLLGDERSRTAVETAEKYADGLINGKEALAVEEAAAAVIGNSYARLGEAARQWWDAGYEPSQPPPEGAAELVAAHAVAITLALWAQATWGALEAARHAAKAMGPRRTEERAIQAGLFRDLIKKYRKPKLDPSWLAWNDRVVKKMAQAIYGGRAFDWMPLLADALEDAGCADAALLGHCRGGGEHVRGCWVIDLLLGKE